MLTQLYACQEGDSIIQHQMTFEHVEPFACGDGMSTFQNPTMMKHVDILAYTFPRKLSVHICNDHHHKLRRCKVRQIDENGISDFLPNSANINRMPRIHNQLSSMYREFMQFLRIFLFEPDIEVSHASSSLGPFGKQQELGSVFAC
ncbi:hypothetical protein ACH5RR_040890 [Cinchona calisaya]|uniref:Uncharacterized protein n=1 Tax=Cinchona calisaya TaxID=153742 RepID=A0ABD2XTK2_9GENT